MAFGNVNITPQLIQAVRDSVDILEVAASITRLEKRGKDYRGLCPFHKEKSPSFNVDPTKGLFYCFGCGVGGDAIRLHMLSSGDDFPAAIEVLARANGIPLPSAVHAGRTGPDPEEILAAAAELYQTELARSEKATDYLSGRRISEAVAKRFRLGFAPERFDFIEGALRSRFRAQDLEAAGLLVTKDDKSRYWDRFRDRLMFPILGVSGRIVGFGGRTLGNDPKAAKYLNTPETERFQKRNLLYGLHHARSAVRERGALLLVEGYFDLLAAVLSGVEWVAASMGTALTVDQARLAARYAEEVVIAYDGDNAGEEASRRALPILLAQGLKVRRLRLPAGADPDSVRLEAGEAALAKLIDEAPDAVELEIDRQPSVDVADPHALARSAHHIRSVLMNIPDAVARFAYGRQASTRLGIPNELLWKPDSRSGAGSAAGANRTGHQAAPGSRGASAGGGEVGAGVGPQARVSRPIGTQRQVSSLEERVLQMLLSGDLPIPPSAQLPVPEVFLDPACGNIFRTFLAIHAEVGGIPDVRVLLDALAESPETLDRAARILLETSSCSEAADELEDSFRRLTRRWQRDRLRKLALDITDAQRNGDLVRLDTLIQEKNSLTRALHELEA